MSKHKNQQPETFDGIESPSIAPKKKDSGIQLDYAGKQELRILIARVQGFRSIDQVPTDAKTLRYALTVCANAIVMASEVNAHQPAEGG